MNKIKYFFDYTCPFSYIGFKYLDILSNEYDIDVSYISIITHSEISDKGIQLSKYYDKYDDLKIIYDYAKSLGEDIDLEINFFDKKYSSYKATLYGLYATENNKMVSFINKIYEAVFKSNKNISSENFLSHVLYDIGLNISEANKYIEDGKYRWYSSFIANEIHNYNINTVPTFVINEKIIVGIHNLNMYKLYLE